MGEWAACRAKEQQAVALFERAEAEYDDVEKEELLEACGVLCVRYEEVITKRDAFNALKKTIEGSDWRLQRHP